MGDGETSMKSTEVIARPGSEGSEGTGFPLYYLSTFPFFTLRLQEEEREKDTGSTIENQCLHFLQCLTATPPRPSSRQPPGDLCGGRDRRVSSPVNTGISASPASPSPASPSPASRRPIGRTRSDHPAEIGGLGSRAMICGLKIPNDINRFYLRPPRHRSRPRARYI